VGDRNINQERKLTKSTTFIRDMLGFHPRIFTLNYYNTYISTDPRSIYLVFKFKEEELKEVRDLLIEKELINNIEFIEKIYKDLYEIYRFDVPYNQSDNFFCFVEGKYTQFGDEYKKYLLELYKDYNHEKYLNIKKILYPTRKDLDALEEILQLDFKLPDYSEVFDKPIMKEELFNIDRFKKDE